MKRIEVHPSLLALSEDAAVARRQLAGLRGVADSVHVDLMDGLFVPGNTLKRFPPEFVERECAGFKTHVHFMTERPSRYYASYAKAGAASLCFHFEAVQDAVAELKAIKALDLKAGFSIKPATQVDDVSNLLELADFVLVMTVEPGKGGQPFLKEMLPKISAFRKAAPQFNIAVDGGIKKGTARLAAEAGANWLIAGSALFGEADAAKALEALRKDALSNAL